MNKEILIAGFFRYHREKLNYSQRGLIGDNKIVELSSLCDFENGKRTLSEEQLTYLFNLIGYDYKAILSSNEYLNEYHKILDYILNSEINLAEDLFLDIVGKNVFNTLGCLNFAIINYALSVITKKELSNDVLIINSCLNLLNSDQRSILKIIDGINLSQNGRYRDSIICYEDALLLTYDYHLRAWAFQRLGNAYSHCGDYYNAQKYSEMALSIYSNELNFKRMIQVNLNIGTICMLTNSCENAESSYRKAYFASLKLKDASKITTKCFNTLCWFYFKTNQYEKFTEFSADEISGLILKENTYFVLAWANYKLGNVGDAVRYCREGKEKFPDNVYACTVYEYIERAVMGKKTGQDILLKKAITMEDYEHNKEIDELFTMELIDIYERRKNYEKAYKYARKLLNH